MKLAIRIFALSIVVAGFAAATTPKTARALPSRQSATATFPGPVCGPYLCPPEPAGPQKPDSTPQAH
jgi:hypothetical protein